MNDPDMPHLVDQGGWPDFHGPPRMPAGGTPWPHAAQVPPSPWQLPPWGAAPPDPYPQVQWAQATPAAAYAVFPGAPAPPQAFGGAPFPNAGPPANLPPWPSGPPQDGPPPMMYNNNPAAGHIDDWVHVGNDDVGPNWEWPKDGFPTGHRPGSLSRASSSPYSHHSSPSSHSSRGSRRSKSFSRPVHERDKRPPREWRSDFSMPKTPILGAALGSLFSLPRRNSLSRKPSATSTTRPTHKVELHPYLRYNGATAPSMLLDLRDNPSHVRFRDLTRPINNWDLTRFACEPPLPHMRLYSPHLPWYIEVDTDNPSGVTLHELLGAIWVCMMTPISHADYWNNEMDEMRRERVACAWAARCGEDEEERARGVKRVDFLADRVYFEGLVKGKEGMWEMKIKKQV